MNSGRPSWQRRTRLAKKEDEARFIIVLKEDTMVKKEHVHGTRETLVRWERCHKERNELPRNYHSQNSKGHEEPVDDKWWEGKDERDKGGACGCQTIWA